MGLNTIIYGVIFVLYFAVMFAIGFHFYRKNTSMKDYVIGGRQLGPWTAAMSAQASDMSGWLLIGLPGTAYAVFAGTTEAIWTAIGLAIGTYLNWLIIAKRFRKYTQVAGDSITLPDYFENRFMDKSKVLRVFSAIFITIFFLVYTASQFSAGAKLFSAVFGVDYLVGLCIGSVIIVGYTFLGGFLAVCWTDLVQGILMFAALLAVPIILIVSGGGMGNIMENLNAIASQEAEGAYQVFQWLPRNAAGGIAVLVLISSVGWGLGYCGQPHIITRFMAVKSSKEIRPARIIAIIWVVLTLAGAVIVGMIGRSYLPEVLADPENVFMVVVQTLFSNLPIIAGILLIAILSAIMSTADSQLLVTSTAITNDIYYQLFNKKASQKKLMSVSRISVICVAVAAFLLALDSNSSVFGLVANAWAGFGATFGPCILISLFWKRMTKNGAVAGMITGGLFVLLWDVQMFGASFGISYLLPGVLGEVYELVPGFILSAAVIFIVSLLGKKDEALLKQHEEVLKCEF